MHTFTITIKGRTDNLTETVQASNIFQALGIICKKCMDEDNTGYFFEAEYADVEALQKQDNVIFFTLAGYKYGAELASYSVTF
jgi:cell division protein FtsI/penicillin-binding protein 2